MVTPYINIKREPRFRVGNRVQNIYDVFNSKWVAILESDGEYTILPSWWARSLTIRTLVNYIRADRLYLAFAKNT